LNLTTVFWVGILLLGLLAYSRLSLRLDHMVELPRFGGRFTAFGIIPEIAHASHTPWATSSRGPNGGDAGCTSPR